MDFRDPAATPGGVRPLRARRALPERAQEVAASLVEGWDGQVPIVDLTAYTPADEAGYVYRQRRDGSEHLGLVLEVSREAVEAGRLRGHEAVFPERVRSLAEDLETGHPRTSLISALAEVGDAYRTAVTEVSTGRPDLEVTTADGGVHALWRVDDQVFAAVSAELAETVLYIADGHHRVAATRSLWATRPRHRHDGLPVVVHPLDGLRLEPFHRLAAGPLPAGRLELLMARLGTAYDVVEVAQVPALGSDQVAMYADRRWLLATARERPEVGAAGLAGVVLERTVLAPSGTSTVPLRAPLGDLARRCDEEGSVLFALPAPPLSTVIAIADSDDVMPAKATSFQPKPVSGLLLTQ